MASATVTPVMLIGQPALRGTAKPVATDLPTLWACLASLVNTMTQNGTVPYLGNGLSGPQIGQSVQTFLTIDPVTLAWGFYANPVILDTAGASGAASASGSDDNTWNTASLEGCLSIPSTEMGTPTPYNIPRLKSYSIRYYTLCDAAGNTLPAGSPTSLLPPTAPAGTTVKQLTVPIKYVDVDNATDPKTNELNWVIQHEVDHLNGVLFTDYARLANPYGTNDLATEVFGRAMNYWPVSTYLMSANNSITGSGVSTPDALSAAQQQLIYGNLAAG